MSSCWSASRLVYNLGIKYPIIQAPMAGGPATPQLAAAVSNAGGLGSLGCGYLSPDAIRNEITRTRLLTDKPFAVGLFTPSETETTAVTRGELLIANQLLNPYRTQLGLPLDPPLPTKFAENLDAQLQVVLEEKPAVFVFTFGVPPKGFLKECRQRKIKTIGTVTCPKEVLSMTRSDLEDVVDFVCAQGVEAGGHRGNTASLSRPDNFLALIPLIGQIKRMSIVPVIAAGGIMTGQEISACLKLGADAVAMGTAFLLCDEAGTSHPYRAALRDELSDCNHRGTEFTRVISGRLARGLRNRFMKEMKEFDDKIPSYPYQNALTTELRKASVKAGKSDVLSLWAGQGVGGIREMPASRLMQKLVKEAETMLKDLW